MEHLNYLKKDNLVKRWKITYSLTAYLTLKLGKGKGKGMGQNRKRKKNGKITSGKKETLVRKEKLGI